MFFKVDPGIVYAFVEAFRAQPPAPRKERVADLYRRALQEEAISFPEIEDLLLASEWRLYRLTTSQLVEALKVEPVWYYPRPRRSQTESYGFQRIPVAEMARFLIVLERLGLAVDPAPLVEALNANRPRRSWLTDTELHLHWYAKERHRSVPVVLAADERETWNPVSEKLTTPTGYKVEIWRDDEARPVALRATAPKWRPGRAPSLRAA